MINHFLLLLHVFLYFFCCSEMFRNIRFFNDLACNYDYSVEKFRNCLMT